MPLYILKRIFLSLIIVLISISTLFVMIHMAPGDPVNILLGPRATPDLVEKLRLQMGLDQPFIVQLGRFLGNVALGDLGRDVFTDRAVASIVWEQLPYTVILVMSAFFGAIFFGIPLGCFSAISRNSFLDKLTGALSVSVISIPAFVVAIYGLLIFSVYLQWLPAIGVGKEGNLISHLSHLVLPALAIGMGWIGYIARLVRASMLEILNENHVRTARAFGLTEPVVIFRYALRLAILPTIALLGVAIGYMLSSAVFAEIIFARPGVGKLIYDAVTTRNYPVVMGAVLSTTIIFVISTTLSDILSAILDPRIRDH